MPQMSLYFDEALANIVRERATENNISVSKFVSKILYQYIDDTWSKEFLVTLGSLADTDLNRLEQPSVSLDSFRERL